MTLGLPDTVTGFLFDMDGVLTKTASIHAAAWKQMFDEYLQKRDGDDFRPFDVDSDYDEYVDGRPRLAGTQAFLESRGIHLPDGSDGDGADALTLRGLSNRKNELVQEMIDKHGVETFDDAVAYVTAVADAGYHRAVVSSSANTAQVLERAGIADLFDTRIDGVVADRQHLAGKPAPDMFLAGAKSIGLPADHCAVFEDALSGVEAGRAGHFAVVVGVDRVGQADALRRHGADITVTELTELLDRPRHQ